MSNQSPKPSDDMPRIERWLVVATASLVPLAVAVFMPPALQIALWLAGGALLVGGLAMAAARRRHHGADAPAPASRADGRSEAA